MITRKNASKSLPLRALALQQGLTLIYHRDADFAISIAYPRDLFLKSLVMSI